MLRHAVVLGGVVVGGKGGVIGPIMAAFILHLVRTDLTLLAVDHHVTTIIEGSIIVVAVMLGASSRCGAAPHEPRRNHQLSAARPLHPPLRQRAASRPAHCPLLHCGAGLNVRRSNRTDDLNS
jgi:hypothetical protein